MLWETWWQGDHAGIWVGRSGFKLTWRSNQEISPNSIVTFPSREVIRRKKISLWGNSLIKHQTLIAHILRKSIANSAESWCVDVGSERVDPYTASLHPGVQICTSWRTVREGWWNASKNSAMNQQATHESINTSSFFRSAEGMEAVETGIYFGNFWLWAWEQKSF